MNDKKELTKSIVKEDQVVKITAEEFWSLPGSWNGIFYGKDKNIVYKGKEKFVLSPEDIVKLKLLWLDSLKKTNMGEYIAYLTGHIYDISDQIDGITKELKGYFESVKKSGDKRTIATLLLYLKGPVENLYKAIQDVENVIK